MIMKLWRMLPRCWSYFHYNEDEDSYEMTTAYIWAFNRKWEIFSIKENK